MAKEIRARMHFDKVVHIHQQMNLLKSSRDESPASDVSDNILRNTTFANQMSVTDLKKRKPLYFLNTSNTFNASNPNTLRDMGPIRNCEYIIGDVTD